MRDLCHTNKTTGLVSPPASLFPYLSNKHCHHKILALFGRKLTKIELSFLFVLTPIDVFIMHYTPSKLKRLWGELHLRN